MASSSASQRPPPPPIPAANTGAGGTDTATVGTTGTRPEPEDVENTQFMIDMACACVDFDHWNEILIRDHDVNPASLDCHEGFGIPAIEHVPHELLVKLKLDKKIPEFDPSSFGKPLTWNKNGSYEPSCAWSRKVAACFPTDVTGENRDDFNFKAVYDVIRIYLSKRPLAREMDAILDSLFERFA